MSVGNIAGYLHTLTLVTNILNYFFLIINRKQCQGIYILLYCRSPLCVIETAPFF